MTESDTAHTTPPEPPPETLPEFQLRISEDRMALLLTGAVGPSESVEDFIYRICAAMVKMGITGANALGKAAQRIRETVAAGTPIEALLLAEGQAPVPPQDGKIAWAQEFFKKGFEIDPESGMVDYRRRAEKLNVAAEQLLATVYPPEEGKDGLDIFGNPIPAAKPVPAHIRAGNNVRYNEEDETYYALKDGRLRFIDGALSVDDVYNINSDVGLKTGHIKHPGSVVIKGNVQSESKVEADGDIEIYGHVEDAEIRAGGNLAVHGGISGGTHCNIFAGGSIHAKFIENATLQCDGDVVIEREMDQCHVRTLGAVSMENGRIIGGEIRALGGIECDQIGSDAYIRTVLIAGEDFTLREKVGPKEAELQKLKEGLSKIAEKLIPFKNRAKNLPPRLKELVTVLLEEATKTKAQIEVLEREIEAIRSESSGKAHKEVIVRKRIYPDAFIQIPPLSLLLKEEIDGPVRAGLHEGQLRLMKARLKH